MMQDSFFLGWIQNRLVYRYGESPNVDFVQKLGEVADRIEAKDTEITRLKIENEKLRESLKAINKSLSGY